MPVPVVEVPVVLVPVVEVPVVVPVVLVPVVLVPPLPVTGVVDAVARVTPIEVPEPVFVEVKLSFA